MTRAEQLAAFAVQASYDHPSEEVRRQLKIRILDALGCAIGALEGEPVQLLRSQVDEFGGAELCTLIGGGEEGAQTHVRTKEEADHSLPYMVAVAILDGEVTPRQYEPERIQRSDVQELLRKVTVRPSNSYTRRFPDEMPCRLAVTLRNGLVLVKEKRDYEGFHTRPMPWNDVVRKFQMLASPYTDPAVRRKIIDMVDSLEAVSVRELTKVLTEVRVPAASGKE